MPTNQFPNMGPRLGEVRVLTLNLWGQHGAWPDRREVLIDGLRSLRRDLIALQETIKNEEYDQVIDLLGPGWSVAHQKGRDLEGMGISIASRWPLGEVQEVDLHVTPRTGNFPCGTLVAEVLAPNPLGPLLFVNHFPNWQVDFEYERELQAVLAARVIEERWPEMRVMLVAHKQPPDDTEAAEVRPMITSDGSLRASSAALILPTPSSSEINCVFVCP